MWSISWWFVGNLRGINMCWWMQCQNRGAGERLDEFGQVGNEGKDALLLGKGVEGVSKSGLAEMCECVS